MEPGTKLHINQAYYIVSPFEEKVYKAQCVSKSFFKVDMWNFDNLLRVHITSIFKTEIEAINHLSN